MVANWAAEAARFAPDLTVVAVSGTAARRGRRLGELAAGADVVVTSYTLLRIDFAAYAELGWSGLLLDEAQYAKNHQSKIYQCARRLPAPVKIAITGTPMENNLMELWSLLSITAPGLFPDPGRFREYYAKPIERDGAGRTARPAPAPDQAAGPAPHQGAGGRRPAAPSRSRCWRSSCIPGTARSTRPSCSGNGRRYSG